MVQYQPEDKNKQRREWLQKAIEFAMNNQWEEAVKANKAILALSPDDAEAFNRLGKAYMSLRKWHEAHDAYQEAARLMPHNTIAE
ncbi:MAG: tetratricopeptide repeat protein, partial [Chloroflexi bacterium]|nr:tetratricopeptide repeat protein [Chloroflexota bacterium]